MPNPDVTAASVPFERGICQLVSSALAGATKSSWQVAKAETASEKPLSIREAACYRCSFSGSLKGDAILVVQHKVLEMLAIELDPGAATPQLEKLKMILFSALESSTPKLTGSLSELGAVMVVIELVDNPELSSTEALDLVATSASSSEQATFYLYMSEELSAGLKAASQRMSRTTKEPAAGSTNLDLVLDVELNVTLRFGQRQLPLRDVLELTTGSVVELDRQLDEPVELILDGRVVARGEAVVIDGNYGIRVTEVLQRVLN